MSARVFLPRRSRRAVRLRDPGHPGFSGEKRESRPRVTQIHKTERIWKVADPVGNQNSAAAAPADAFDGRLGSEKPPLPFAGRHQPFLADIHEAIFIIQDQTIKFSNGTADQVLGDSAGELAAVLFPDDAHPENGEKRRRPNGLDDAKPVSGLHTFRTRDRYGEELWIETNTVPITLENRPASLVCLRNVTEKRRLEAQFVHAQKMEAIGKLAGGLAHDFNNLLTVIQTNCQLALLDLKEADPLRETFESIQKAGDKAAGLTRALLAFSRREKVQTTVVDVNLLIRELEPMLGRILGGGIEFVPELSRDLGRVRTDARQIEQAILNVAVNAREVMPNGGKLMIRTANVDFDSPSTLAHGDIQPGRYVMLSASDTGLMADAEGAGPEPSFPSPDKGMVSGLGISRAYGFVKQNGGDVWVSGEPGRGSTFRIYLPRVDEPGKPSRKKIPRRELTGAGEAILVVEDDEEVRKSAGAILRDQGYRVWDAPHGAEALQITASRKEPIHLLLTDLVLPEINGLELARHLWRFQPGLKVLCMSGYTDYGIFQQNTLPREKIYFLQKPFSFEGLIEKVRWVLDH